MVLSGRPCPYSGGSCWSHTWSSWGGEALVAHAGSVDPAVGESVRKAGIRYSATAYPTPLVRSSSGVSCSGSKADASTAMKSCHGGMAVIKAQTAAGTPGSGHRAEGVLGGGGLPGLVMAGRDGTASGRNLSTETGHEGACTTWDVPRMPLCVTSGV